MNTLESLHSWIVSQLQAWLGSEDVRTLESEAFAEDQFHFKVRAQLKGSFQLQVRFYYNRGHLDYAYQLFTDAPVLHWDNKEDAGDVPTSPHHFHNSEGAIVASPLKGDPAHDWPLVRVAIEQYVNEHLKPD